MTEPARDVADGELRQRLSEGAQSAIARVDPGTAEARLRETLGPVLDGAFTSNV